MNSTLPYVLIFLLPSLTLFPQTFFYYLEGFFFVFFLRTNSFLSNALLLKLCAVNDYWMYLKIKAM